MVDIPVISVIGRGSVERVTMRLERRTDEPTVEIEGAADAGGVTEQLTLARAVARMFLTSPYVGPVARDTLERGVLVARFEGPEPVHGRGLGLAFLAGCLSLGLGAPLRDGRVFYSSLSKQVGRRRMPGGGALLEAVMELEQELAADGIGRPSRLFFCGEEEQALPESDPCVQSGEAERPCALPVLVSTAALAAMALDTRVLLQRAAGVDDGAAFCLLLLWSCGEVKNGASFPEGIGAALARLKARGRLTAVPAITDLVGDALSDPYGEAAADDALKHGIDSLSETMLQRELVKAAISGDPGLPVLPGGPSPAAGATRSEVDLEEWLAAEAPDTLQRLWLGLNVLSICRENRSSWRAGRGGPAAIVCAATAMALVGTLAWYGLMVLTGYDLGWALWILGALVGFVTLQAARWPDRTTGALAAICSAAAILGAVYLAESRSEEMALRDEAEGIYSKMAALAPLVCAAQTDDEIRAAIAELNCEDDADQPNLAAVSDDDRLSFESEIRPRYQGVLDGHPTRRQFVNDFAAVPRWDRMAVMEEALSVGTLIWVFLGSSMAFVIASDVGIGPRRRVRSGPMGRERSATAAFTRNARP